MLFNTVTNLKQLRQSTSYKQVVETAVRIKRLAQKSEQTTIDASLFTQQEETNALAIFDSEKDKQIPDLTKLSDPFTAYFDNVLVMDKDEKIKNNRLSFLAEVNTLFFKVADFEKIVIS